ncbi:hypothetical protein OTU49_004267, partial [Cherax quadricarinatus]
VLWHQLQPSARPVMRHRLWTWTRCTSLFPHLLFLYKMFQRKKIYIVLLVAASLFIYTTNTSLEIKDTKYSQGDVQRTHHQAYNATYTEILFDSRNIMKQSIKNMPREFNVSKGSYEKARKVNKAADINASKKRLSEHKNKIFNIENDKKKVLNSLPISKREHFQLHTVQLSPEPKTVLFHSTFFSESWNHFANKKIDLKQNNCPISNCVFLYNSSHPEDADAVIFHHGDFRRDKVPNIRRPQQWYIWLNLESPSSEDFSDSEEFKKRWSARDNFFNWSYTYHRDSDLLLLYGGLRSIRGEGEGPRPGLLDTAGATYEEYLEALGRDSLLDDTSHDWHTFLSRPKLVAWMVSHCSTFSGREFYVKELQKYISVDVYGLCGDFRCGKSHKDQECYANVLRPKYKFYLAFEN